MIFTNSFKINDFLLQFYEKNYFNEKWFSIFLLLYVKKILDFIVEKNDFSLKKGLNFIYNKKNQFTKKNYCFIKQWFYQFQFYRKKKDHDLLEGKNWFIIKKIILYLLKKIILVVKKKFFNF